MLTDCAKLNKNLSFYLKKKDRFIMKAKYHIGIISILLIYASSLRAQVNDIGNYGVRTISNSDKKISFPISSSLRSGNTQTRLNNSSKSESKSSES